jgi:hypothetical protein
MTKKISLKKIACSNCGAELIFDPGTQMTNCNFCGTKFEINLAENEEFSLPDGILPFKISKEQYEQAVLSWLSEGDYTPDDILDSTLFESVNGVYLPMWLYKGRYHGNWSASSGYDRIEEYYEWSESQKKRVRQTRKITDWRPSSGQCSGEYTILAFAGNGTGISSDIAIYAHHTEFSRGDIKPFNSQYTSGFNLIDFTSDEHDTWDGPGKSQADRQIWIDTKKRIPGDQKKDFYCDVLYENEVSSKVYIPFWITYYKYNEVEFHVFMDGTSTSRIDGIRPVDKERIKKINKKFEKATFPMFLTIGLFIFAFFFDSDKGRNLMFSISLFSLGITLALLALASYQKKKIIEESKQRREEILKNHIIKNE